MRELLKAAETVVDEYKGFASPHFHSLLEKLEEAIAAAKVTEKKGAASEAGNLERH